MAAHDKHVGAGTQNVLHNWKMYLLSVCFRPGATLIKPWLSTCLWESNEKHDGHQRTSGQVRQTLGGFFGFGWHPGNKLFSIVCWYYVEWVHWCTFMQTSFFSTRYNAVWIIFFILGLGTLLPWNFFMTATMVSNILEQWQSSECDNILGTTDWWKLKEEPYLWVN